MKGIASPGSGLHFTSSTWAAEAPDAVMVMADQSLRTRMNNHKSHDMSIRPIALSHPGEKPPHPNRQGRYVRRKGGVQVGTHADSVQLDISNSLAPLSLQPASFGQPPQLAIPSSSPTF